MGIAMAECTVGTISIYTRANIPLDLGVSVADTPEESDTNESDTNELRRLTALCPIHI